MSGFIGVLMLDTAFERIPGDAGNPASYHRPARIRVVPQADVPDIVRDGRPTPALVAAFRAAARAFEAEGAVAITSTCGFLVTVQQDIAAGLRIPVMVSALSLFPALQAELGGPIGILTAARPQLGQGALRAAGIDPAQAVIAGMEQCPAFASAILARKGDQPDRIDRVAIEAAAVAQARALCDARPDLRAILLECGNLPPYAAAIRAATGKPVYSILDAMRRLAP